MLCPYCKTEIVITNNTEVCPFCRENIASEVKDQLAAEECVHRLLTAADISIIEELLVEDRSVEAMRLISRIRGKMEPFVEVRVLRMIKQSTTNEQLLNRIKEADSEKQPPVRLVPCVACGNQISTQAETCPHCGQPTGVHICPNCSSANTKVISGASKATSVFLWGPFAANKVISKFQCKDCGHKF